MIWPHGLVLGHPEYGLSKGRPQKAQYFSTGTFIERFSISICVRIVAHNSTQPVAYRQIATETIKNYLNRWEEYRLLREQKSKSLRRLSKQIILHYRDFPNIKNIKVKNIYNYLGISTILRFGFEFLRSGLAASSRSIVSFSIVVS